MHLPEWVCHVFARMDCVLSDAVIKLHGRQ